MPASPAEAAADVSLLGVSLLAATALQGATLRGLVVDPLGGPVTAVVEVTCGSAPAIKTSVAGGEFVVANAAAGSCRVRVTAQGFDTLERRCTAGQPAQACRLQLRMSPQREEVTVTAARADLSAVAVGGAMAASFSAADLRVAGPDVAAWLDLAQRAAGDPVGAREVRVGGVPSAILPPSRAIGAVTVNADPFGVETLRTDRVRMDLFPAINQEPWHVQVRPPVARVARPEPLRGTPAGVSRDAGISGGFRTHWSIPMAATVALQRLSSTEHPTYLEGQPGSEALLAGIPVEDREDMAYGSLAVTHPRFEFSQTGLASNAHHSNAGVGGSAGLASAVSSESRIRAFHSTWRYQAKAWSSRGFLAWDTTSHEGHSLATGAGVVAAGRLRSGAGDPVAFKTAADVWQSRFIVEAPQPAGRWLLGAEAVSRVVADGRTFNPLGQFIVSPDGSDAGQFTRDGLVSVVARERTAALFAQSVVVQSRRLWLRLGARADWQEGHGTWLSPRLSVATPIGRYIVAGNAGLFVDPWLAEHENELRVRQQAPVLWVSPSSTVTTTGRGIRRHDVVARASVMRMLGNVRIAAEESMTRGRSLGGLVRRRDGLALVDELRAEGELVRWQSHLRIDLPIRGWMVTGHYSFAHSIDTTDGMFSVPAIQTRLQDERGPSTGIARHSANVTVRARLPGAIQVLLLATAASGTPYTLVTGADPEGLLTFTGRADVGRNARWMPGRHDVSAYLARRFALPFAGLGIDAGVRLENLFAATQILDLDPVASSAYAGMPIRASSGPRVVLWGTLGK